MARSKGRGNKGGGAARSTSRKSAPAVEEVEIVEESGGMGAEDGVAIVTFLLLLVGFLMLDYDRGKNYGEGFMFKAKYAESNSAGN